MTPQPTPPSSHPSQFDHLLLSLQDAAVSFGRRQLPAPPPPPPPPPPLLPPLSDPCHAQYLTNRSPIFGSFNPPPSFPPSFFSPPQSTPAPAHLAASSRTAVAALFDYPSVLASCSQAEADRVVGHHQDREFTVTGSQRERSMDDYFALEFNRVETFPGAALDTLEILDDSWLESLPPITDFRINEIASMEAIQSPTSTLTSSTSFLGDGGIFRGEISASGITSATERESLNVYGSGRFDVSITGDSSTNLDLIYVSDEPNLQKDSSKKRKREGKGDEPRCIIVTKSDLDILDDGYRWRKYGQKSVKHSNYPRSYYKCSHRDCHVQKLVERSAIDSGFVMTTYMGIHTHQCPPPRGL